MDCTPTAPTALYCHPLRLSFSGTVCQSWGNAAQTSQRKRKYDIDPCLNNFNSTVVDIYYSFLHIIRTIFGKLCSAPLLPPGLGVRESAHEQFPSSCPQPTEGYTHEHRKFNRSLPPLAAFIPIWKSHNKNLQLISYLCIPNTLWFRDKRFWPKFCLRRSWRH